MMTVVALMMALMVPLMMPPFVMAAGITTWIVPTTPVVAIVWIETVRGDRVTPIWIAVSQVTAA